jgi:diguanylate cyclase (GGDEF)-like protein
MVEYYYLFWGGEMNTKNKITFILMSIIFMLFLLLIANVIYNFRNYGIQAIDEKARAVAETIKHTLTSQMVTGVIENRELFLSQIEDLQTIDKIWLSRGESVVQEYGRGFNNEVARDVIDKTVLQSGKELQVINDNMFGESTYRITIPYIATSSGKINCMECHTSAKEGDTLGAISITMSIDGSKNAGIRTVVNTALIALAVMVTILIFINYLISPFLTIFDCIREVMSKAQEGDYSHRIESAKGKEAQDVAKWINTLLEKLSNTLDSIDEKISVFLSGRQLDTQDNLINVKNTVARLSDVYKFRKTIEHDENLNEVYERLAFVFKRKLGLDNFNFFEADTVNDSVKLVYSAKEVYCQAETQGCRADRTNTTIDSCQFTNICSSCKTDKDYVCLPYSISNELDLIISIYTEGLETQKAREVVPIIKDYVDASKTVIVSKKLMSILEHNANSDALTGLYNRKYLEDSIEKITSQAQRAHVSFGVLMLDIDHFKQVNDTYGHDVGDNAIRILAQTLVENTRTSDICIRYGGEEFIVLLYDCDMSHVEIIAEKIREAFLGKIIPAGKTTIQKTISIGTSVFPNDNEDLMKCIKYADVGLYEAKETGRNKVIPFSPELIKEETNS